MSIALAEVMDLNGPLLARQPVYVKLFNPEDGYASVIRLWEETLTDGSKVYEMHIL